MPDIPITVLTRAIADLLTEAYAGPPNPHSTWFVDNEVNSGIFGALDRVTAEEASTPVGGAEDPGSTIAANAEHLRWSLALGNAYFRGESPSGNWSESWQLIRAEPARWDALRAGLKSEFETLRDAILKADNLEGPFLMGTLAFLPHAAFHLGLIRQMIERVKEPK